MKQRFKVVVLLFSLVVLTACGQGTTETQMSQHSEVESFSTTLKTKSFIETRVSKEEQAETKEEKEEAEENVKELAINSNDSSDINEVNETTSSAAKSASSEGNKNASDTNRKNQQTSSSDKQSSSNSSSSSSVSSSNNSSTTTEKKLAASSDKKKKPTQDSKPTPKEPEKPTTPTEPKITVTISVSSGEFNGPNIAATVVEIKDGETVFSVTKKLLSSKGISINSVGSGPTLYVKGFGGLDEFDEGPLSGWQVYVQGQLISKSSDAFEVLDGQTIHWNYTKNFLEE